MHIGQIALGLCVFLAISCAKGPSATPRQTAPSSEAPRADTPRADTASDPTAPRAASAASNAEAPTSSNADGPASSNRASNASDGPSAKIAASAIPAPPSPPDPHLSAALADILRSHKLRGVVARVDGDSRTAACSDVARCKKPLLPASTYKIPNAMIGLETGVISDADYLIPWDGTVYEVKEWNRDHTLRTAIQASAVWYFQELARRVGKEREQEWLHRLAYGNQQLGDVVDRFWLDGPLAITPLEQLDFLRRWNRAQLPISERTRSIVLEITVKGDVDGRTLHGKTGWANPGKPDEIGWFVGFVEDPVAPSYVAVALDRVPKGVDMLTIRQNLAEEALRAKLE